MSWFSNSRRSVTSRMFSTSAPTFGSSSRFVTEISAWQIRPSARTRGSSIVATPCDRKLALFNASISPVAASGSKIEVSGVPINRCAWWPNTRSMDSLWYCTTESVSTTLTTSELCSTSARKRCSLVLSSSVRSATRASRPRVSARFSSIVSTWRPTISRISTDRSQEMKLEPPPRPCSLSRTVVTTAATTAM